MKIKLLGSGCTRSTPKPGCTCEACTDAKSKGWERKRFSLLIEHKGKRVLVDASPDLRQQLLDNDLGTKDIDAVLITHAHYDHIGGLDEFYCTEKQEKVPIYCTQETLLILQKKIDYLLNGRFIEVHEAKDEFSLFGMTVKTLKLDHGIFPTCGYSIRYENKKIIIMNDSTGNLQEKELEEAKGCDLLIVDTFLFDKETKKRMLKEVNKRDFTEEEMKNAPSTHMTIAEAKELSKLLGAKKTIGAHIYHGNKPHDELVNKYQTKNFLIGYDNMEIEV